MGNRDNRTAGLLRISRRQALGTMSIGVVGQLVSQSSLGQGHAEYRLATFAADVTPPLGHPMIAGWRQPANKISDPLEARGVILLGAGEPIVVVSVDWCELRNDAYDMWREKLAAAVGTTRERVLVSCVHQHDAPYADLFAQRLLDEAGSKETMFNREFHDRVVDRVARAAADSVQHAQAISHFGTGEAEVQRVACNRRVQLDGDRPRFNRGSFTRDLRIRDAAAGVIDPYLKTLSFFQGDCPVAALNCYATHPMSYYGRGEVSADFPGMARRRRQRDDAGVFQVFLAGCSGDITAAKYNDGTYDGRVQLADRLYQGMVDAWENTERHPLTEIQLRMTNLRFEPESGGSLSVQALQATLADENATHRIRSQAALGLSWRRRCAAGQPVDLPVIDFGPAQFTLLPAESFVQYQLHAQAMCPDAFVMVAGYGECAPGYIPTAETRREGFVKEHGYCWVAAGAERVILDGLARVLKKTP